MRVSVLALDDVFDLGLAAVLDGLQTANELIALFALPVAPFDVRVVGVRSAVRTARGFQVPLSRAHARRPDCVVVPALGFKTPAPLEAALGRPDVGEAGALLRRWSRGGAMTAAACVGTFVLAESGLLDGERATTTWWLAPLFRQRYPAVAVDEATMIVPSGRVVTAGAALSHMDLVLWLIRRVSPQLASLTARYLIVDARPSQAVYAVADHLAHADPVVQRFEEWARRRMPASFSLDEAARAAGASKRTLARRLQRTLGVSPLAYVQRLRLERAVHLLRTSGASVDEIAGEVGYADGATLRALLRRKLRLGVREIRREG